MLYLMCINPIFKKYPHAAIRAQPGIYPGNAKIKLEVKLEIRKMSEGVFINYLEKKKQVKGNHKLIHLTQQPP